MNKKTKSELKTTHLSSKGQIVISKSLRSLHNWRKGEKFTIEDTEQGILIKPILLPHFVRTSLKEVAGCLGYKGKRRSLEEMEKAIAKGASL